MNTVVINDVTIECESNNISITNNKVHFDGKTVEINGDCSISGNSKINITCDKNVIIQGNVTGNVSAEGNISCGNIVGKVKASGNLNCGNIVGGVSR